MDIYKMIDNHIAYLHQLKQWLNNEVELSQTQNHDPNIIKGVLEHNFEQVDKELKIKNKKLRKKLKNFPMKLLDECETDEDAIKWRKFERGV